MVGSGAAPLPHAFYDRPTDLVARELIGCVVEHRDESGLTRRGRIVETEAYLGVRDLACHSSRGRTPRTEVMFGPPGFAYVYLIYGMHSCLNVVTRAEGAAEAVLIRALEPLAGLSKADGPGLVCRALGIDRRLNGADLAGEVLRILPPSTPAGPIAQGPRVGVDYAGAWAKRLLRFWEKGSAHVSRAGGARRGTFRSLPARGIKAR